MPGQSPRNSSLQRARCTPAAGHNFDHHSGDNTLWLGSTPILKNNTIGVVRSFPPLFPFHQPLQRTSARWLFGVSKTSLNAAICIQCLETVPCIF
ncbi:hypothetical protein TNCV_3917421 [Trichonephila clavipes]|nr:hypothetical protein TNCV_3917421 [Trichonephila clavipes]